MAGQRLSAPRWVCGRMRPGAALCGWLRQIRVCGPGVRFRYMVDTSPGHRLRPVGAGREPRGRRRLRSPPHAAPWGVAVDGRSVYVSNEAGRPARPGDVTNNSSGTQIVADPGSGGSATGTVSIVDAVARKEVSTVNVGNHPTGLHVDGHYLFVANTNSDSVSVIDTNTGNRPGPHELCFPRLGGRAGKSAGTRGEPPCRPDGLGEPGVRSSLELISGRLAVRPLTTRRMPEG
jgi:hypothetical protein